MTDFTEDDLKRIEKTLLGNNEDSQSKEDSYYVYMLAIKDENIVPFYIGKGKNLRIFSHENDAKGVIDTINETNDTINKTNDTISEKIKKIINNKKNGQSIERYIIKWGLTENEAFMCESALINICDCLYPNKLTNVINGHASEKEKRSKTHTTKAYEISEFLEKVCIEEVNYEDTLLTNIPVIFIKIENALEQYALDQYKETENIDYERYVYESAQGYWKCNIDRANKAKYVIALQNTVVRGIYRIDKWLNIKELRERCLTPHYPLTFRNNDNKQKDEKFMERRGFIQKKLSDNAENNELDELKKQLLNKVIKEKYQNGKGKSWFKEQNSRYNYDLVGDTVNIREKLRK